MAAWMPAHLLSSVPTSALIASRRLRAFGSFSTWAAEAIWSRSPALLNAGSRVQIS
jgi:hypothetical protein